MVFIAKNTEDTVYSKAIVNRISRSTGHLRSVKTMVESGRDCSEVLIQLAAVKAEINNTSKEILKQYMAAVVEEAVIKEDMEKIKNLGKNIDLFMK